MKTGRHSTRMVTEFNTTQAAKSRASRYTNQLLDHLSTTGYTPTDFSVLICIDWHEPPWDGRENNPIFDLLALATKYIMRALQNRRVQTGLLGITDGERPVWVAPQFDASKFNGVDGFIDRISSATKREWSNSKGTAWQWSKSSPGPAHRLWEDESEFNVRLRPFFSIQPDKLGCGESNSLVEAVKFGVERLYPPCLFAFLTDDGSWRSILTIASVAKKQEIPLFMLIAPGVLFYGHKTELNRSPYEAYRDFRTNLAFLNGRRDTRAYELPPN